MTAFLDASVLVYANVAPKTDVARACGELIQRVAAGALDGRTSVAVVEELWHLELRGRPPGLRGATGNAYVLFTPLLAVTDEVVRRAFDIDAPSLGANDRIHAATCAVNMIDTVVSTDAGFDQVAELERVDPGEPEAVARLVRR